MKKILFIACSFLTYVAMSCSQKNSTSCEIRLKDNISIIVDSFTSQNSNQPIYELYVDKITPDSTILFLYGGSVSLSADENIAYQQYPLLATSSNGKLITIFSGIERYVEFDKPIGATGDTILTHKSFPSEEDAFWVIFDSKDGLKVETSYKSYPFWNKFVGKFSSPAEPQ